MDYSLADVASAVRNNDNGNEFGGGAWWIIVLFLFAFMGNGFGNRNNGDPVTEAGLCNAMNFNNLENTVGRLSDLTQNQTMTLGSAISNTAKDINVRLTVLTTITLSILQTFKRQLMTDLLRWKGLDLKIEFLSLSR